MNEIQAVLQEMRTRMAGKVGEPLPKPVYGGELIEWANRIEAALSEHGGGGEVVATYGVIDPDYARVFTIARCLAWAEGYMLAMHGSFTRDLDLIAVPWTDSACEPEHLMRRIEEAAGLRNITDDPTGKPHGRLVWTLKFKTFGDPRFVDLGIMPPPQPRGEGMALEAMERAAEEIEQGHAWITAVAASKIIRKHAAMLAAAPENTP